MEKFQGKNLFVFRKSINYISLKVNKIKSGLFILLLIGFLSNLQAQIPSLSISNEKGNEKLKIQEMSIEVKVIGNIAVTTFDILFYNQFDKTLEGEFSMSLNQNQEICRYALDINGKLREGVIVEKVKARQAYEAVISQQVDPGIISKTKGNQFKTRIYPILAKGNKRVVIAFSETLSGNRQDLFYELPFENLGIINQFEVELKVYKSLNTANQIDINNDSFKFDNKEDVFFYSFRRENYTLNKPVKFTIPRFLNEDYFLSTYTLNELTYFYLCFKPDELKSVPKKAPEKIAILWDQSNSGMKRNITKEIELLKSYISNLPQKTKFFVTTFNYEVKSDLEFNSADEVLSFLANVKYDGATCFSKLQFNENADEVLLFTDGISTIGKEQPFKEEKPIYVISSVKGSNYSYLKQISSLSNGEFLDLNSISIERAVQILQKDEDKFLSYSFDKNCFKDIYPMLPTRVEDYFEVSGILLKDHSSLSINFGNKRGVNQSKSFKIKSNNSSPFISKIWASKKIKELNLDFEKNQEEILTLSKKYGIVTKNTSLLVLDRVEDYVRYDIVPPKELLKQFELLKKHKIDIPELPMELFVKQNKHRLDALEDWYKNHEKYYRPRGKDEIVNHENIPAPRTNQANVISDDMEIEIVVFEENEELLMDVADFSADDVQYDNHRKTSKIKVLPWESDADYIKKLKAGRNQELLNVYYELKKENLERPAFYLQVADYFFSKGKKSEGIQILTNAIEIDLENPELLKTVARRLLNENANELAVEVFTEIKELRPEEPQSYRDLATAYIAKKEYQKALDLYIQIIDTDWSRFNEIKDVVLNELNNLIALHRKELDLSNVHKSYIAKMPLDIRIVIDWSSNNNDIDLWVIEPNGEKCFYQNKYTKIGGKISTDFTRGYGPEEYTLKNAEKGTYKIFVNYFSESRQTITGPVTVYVDIIKNYGRKDQKLERTAVQLENVENKETIQIGEVEF